MKRLMMLLVVGILLVPTSAWTWSRTPPVGYNLIESDRGVRLYQKGSEFVQVIELDLGARVVSIEQQQGTGNLFRHLSMASAWSDFLGEHPRGFSLFNAQFFIPEEDPGRLAFSLKRNGQPYIGGSEMSTFTSQKVALKIWSIEVKMQFDSPSDDTDYALYHLDNNDPAPDGITALTESADKGVNQLYGRTFIGCGDPVGNGHYKTLFVYSVGDPRYGTGPGKRQGDAANVLESFGAVQVAMLDGGGSSQLRCDGTNYVDGARPVPHFMGIVAGDNTPPTTPTNISVNPSGCSQTNSFTFDWTSTDTGGSGIAGYEWNLDGSQNVSPVTSKPFTTTAPAAGNYMFFVRAYDGAGNRSGFGSIGFCYQPPTGPCGTRQITGCTSPPHPIIPPASAQTVSKQ